MLRILTNTFLEKLQFVDSNSIKQPFRPGNEPRESEFVIVVGCDVNAANIDKDTNFHRIHMVAPYFCGAPEKHAWAIDFKNLNTRDKWKAALAQFQMTEASF